MKIEDDISSFSLDESVPLSVCQGEGGCVGNNSFYSNKYLRQTSCLEKPHHDKNAQWNN